jgi:molybdopterin-guanine dinucleotide biosynthesis protein A
MGRDKARLHLQGESLVGRAARIVGQAAGNVTVIGDPARYPDLAYPVAPDNSPGLGPLGGIHTALSLSRSDRNLIVACDMPDLEAPFLGYLLAAAGEESDCLLPAGASGRPEPLCGVYHTRCLTVITRALERGVRKVLDSLDGLRVTILNVPESRCFRNINTPQDWLEYQSRQADKTPGNGV